MPVERAKRGKVLIIKDVGSLIITIRNQKVIVDRDLAEIYGVETRRLNEQVKRNPERFPEDFMFQLTKEEADSWLRSRSQIAILKRGKNIKYLPYAFTPLEITSHVLYLCNTKQEGQTVLYRIYRRSAEPPPRAQCR
jgi:hypothetical protein